MNALTQMLMGLTDAATGAATVILAMGAGKHAAKAIDEYLKSKK